MRRKTPLVVTFILFFLTFSGLTERVFADVSAQLKQAAAYKDNRQYQQAEAIYQQIVTAFPDTNDALEAQKQLTLVYITTGSQQEANASFNKLITDFSKHKDIATAVWQIGQRYIELKKYDKAFELNQYNVKHFPNDMYAMWSQVEIVYSYIRDGNDAVADAAFNTLLAAFSGQPTLPKEIYQVARKYDELKKYDKAIVLHQYNVEHFPADIHAIWSQVEIIYSRLRDGNEPAANAAVRNLLTVFSKQPTLSQEIYQVARKYDELKKYDKAVVLHQYNVEHFPSDIHAIWSQVEIIYSHLRKGDDAAANAAVDNLLAVFSKQPTLSQEIYQVARKYDELKKYDKAVRLHQYNVDHFSGDIHALWSQVEIIYSHLREGDELAADAAVSNLLTVFSGQPTLSQEIYQVANAYSKAGRNDKAKQLYQKVGQLYQSVIDKNPDSNDELWAKVGMAKLNISVGDDAVVQADVNNLIADFNDHTDLPEAIFTIGEEYYNKALNAKDEPNSPEAKPEEYFQKAISVWERVITKLPASATYTPRFYYITAVVYSQELGEYAKGIEYYQQVVDNWPNYQYAWHAQFFIGMYYEKLRDSGGIPESEVNPKIEQAYKAVVEKYPDSNSSPHAALKLGQLNFNRGQWADAAKYFEIFLEKAPEDQRRVDVLYDLGRAYEQMGELSLAAEMYRIFIEMAAPNDQRIKTVKAVLEKLEGATK